MLRWLVRLLMPWQKAQPRVAVVRLSGVIAAGGRFGTGLALFAAADMLERAFRVPGMNAVALILNSPGGSPAQSHLLFKRIRALAEEKKLPVFAFVEDVAASGGYMLACAADEIFADESSILGSIGVVYAGFGFHDLLERWGVERRVHTAGARKAALDPFRREDPEDVVRLAEIQHEVHQHFIALVKSRRGVALKGNDDELFSGAFWVGREALSRGLIDGVGDVKSVLKSRFGDKVRLIPFTPARGGLWRWRPTRQPGIWPAAFDEGLALLEARALWSRFGL